MFSVAFTQTRADILAFANHFLKIQCGSVYRFVQHYLAPLCWLFLAFIIFSSIGNWRQGKINSFVDVALSLFCFVTIGCLAFWKKFYFGSILKQAQRQPGFGEPVKVQLNDEGVFVQSYSGEALLKWRIITKINRNHNYLFIFISQNSAIAIRDELFEGTKQASQFEQFAQTHWDRAHPTPEAKPLASPH